MNDRAANDDVIEVLVWDHYHCALCDSHLGEQDIRLEPPNKRERVFWCENPECPNYKKSFVALARLVIRERVDVFCEQTGVN